MAFLVRHTNQSNRTMADYSVDVIGEDDYIENNFSGPEHFGITVKKLKQNYRSFLLGKLEIYENVVS